MDRIRKNARIGSILFQTKTYPMDTMHKNVRMRPILFQTKTYPMDTMRKNVRMRPIHFQAKRVSDGPLRKKRRKRSDKIPAGLTLPLTDPASESRRPAPGALLPAVGRHHGFLRPLPLSHKK